MNFREPRESPRLPRAQRFNVAAFPFSEDNVSTAQMSALESRLKAIEWTSSNLGWAMSEARN